VVDLKGRLPAMTPERLAGTSCFVFALVILGLLFVGRDENSSKAIWFMRYTLIVAPFLFVGVTYIAHIKGWTKR
jgi:hypothetical protein